VRADALSPQTAIFVMATERHTMPTAMRSMGSSPPGAAAQFSPPSEPTIAGATAEWNRGHVQDLNSPDKYYFS